jgi:hypothetical protein
MRAGGRITALGSQPGRDHPLVDLYQGDKGQTKNAEYRFHEPMLTTC